MQSFSHRDLPRRAPGEGVEVAHFASQVVSLMADARARASDAGLHAPFVDDLIAASLSVDGADLSRVVSALRRARISDWRLVEGYVPAAARRLGQDWADDRKSFYQVSVGVARLQRLVRALADSQRADAGRGPAARSSGTGPAAARHDPGDQARAGLSVLLAVPQGEQHTLGAVVAACRLRRAGVSVCLRLGLARTEVGHLMAARRVDAALVSVGSEKLLPAAVGLIDTIRNLSAVPVAIGGAILSCGEGVTSCVGADVVNDDPVAALQALGLPMDAERAACRA